MNRRWIPVVLWIALLGALGLSHWSPRLRAIGPALLLLAVGAIVINYLVRAALGRRVRSCETSRWMRVMLSEESKQASRGKSE